MGAHHDHDHGPAIGPDRAGSRRALTLTLGLTAGFMAAEVAGGLITGSLALLADAAHMLSDALSLAVALVAVRLAERPPSPERTFGLKRAEILAALFNGVTLVAISVWIFIEAARRFDDPPEILAGPMLAVAILGLVVNAVAAKILHGGGDDSLNVSAAFRHVLADLAGSVGVIVAAIVILLTGWAPIDPLVSVLIGMLVLGSSWTILRDATQVLLEGSPRGIDVAEVAKDLAGTEGVVNVHDLHVWTITSGFPALSAHILVTSETDCHRKRRELERRLMDGFGIEHTTLQVDHKERELLQIEGVETRGEEKPTAKKSHAFVFADIAGFTALVERDGDRAAVDVVEDFERHVGVLLRRHGGEQVKSIGDAVMLRFDDANAAVRAALELAHHEMKRDDHPAIRIGMHLGPAERRGGDWLGGTVNIAARVASLARGDEVLATQSLLSATELEGIEVVDRRAEKLHNVAEPVQVARIACHPEDLVATTA